MINMTTAVLEITLRASWVHSLKEKRMIVQSLLKKIKNKFNVSVAEIENQDKHQIITIGIVGITSNNSYGDGLMDHIINFVESNTEAEIIDIIREYV